MCTEFEFFYYLFDYFFNSFLYSFVDLTPNCDNTRDLHPTLRGNVNLEVTFKKATEKLSPYLCILQHQEV